MCVRDLFNKVLMPLDRQAHLYDCFPHTTSHLSWLRATIPAHGCEYGDSLISISHCNATGPRMPEAVAAAHTVNVGNQQVHMPIQGHSAT